MAHAQILMAQAPLKQALAPLLVTVTVRTGFRPLIAGGNDDFPSLPFNDANLIVGQSQNDLVVGQSISPKIVLPIWDQGLPPSLIKSQRGFQVFLSFAPVVVFAHFTRLSCLQFTK